MAKGQEISEWIFEVVALPKLWKKKFEKFCPVTLGFFKFFLSMNIWCRRITQNMKFPDLCQSGSGTYFFIEI